jgi:hypothetical protein
MMRGRLFLRILAILLVASFAVAPRIVLAEMALVAPDTMPAAAAIDADMPCCSEEPGMPVCPSACPHVLLCLSLGNSSMALPVELAYDLTTDSEPPQPSPVVGRIALIDGPPSPPPRA